MADADNADRQYDVQFGLLGKIYAQEHSTQNIVLDMEKNEEDRTYQAQVRLKHGYFLSTMLNMRSIEHVCCDLCMVIVSMFLFFAAMNILVAKDKIEPYW